MPNNKTEPKSLIYIKGAFAAQTDKCIIWPFSINKVDGYAYFGTGGKDGFFGRVHAYVCEMVHGPKPTLEHQAAHSCHNRICINPRHISWKTPSQNMRDKRENGTTVAHRTGYRGKLSPDEVREIRNLEGEMTQEAIAKKFGVTQSNVRKIQTRQQWKSIA